MMIMLCDVVEEDKSGSARKERAEPIDRNLILSLAYLTAHALT